MVQVPIMRLCPAPRRDRLLVAVLLPLLSIVVTSSELLSYHEHDGSSEEQLEWFEHLRGRTDSRHVDSQRRELEWQTPGGADSSDVSWRFASTGEAMTAQEALKAMAATRLQTKVATTMSRAYERMAAMARQKAKEAQQRRMLVETGVHTGTSSTRIFANMMKMGKCKTCVYAIERIKMGRFDIPEICSELYIADTDAYPVCQEVLGALAKQGNNARYWIIEGCYKYEIYGAKEWAKPCPSHVICTALTDKLDQPFCPPLPLEDPFSGQAASEGGEGGYGEPGDQ